MPRQHAPASARSSRASPCNGPHLDHNVDAEAYGEHRRAERKPIVEPPGMPLGRAKRPSRHEGQSSHAKDRSEAEQRDIGNGRPGFVRRSDSERKQACRARGTVHEADDQGTKRKAL